MCTQEQTELEIYFSENRERLLNFIVQKVNDPELAEDLLQESLLNALRSSEKLKDESKLAPWFYQIIRNAIIDVYRRQGRQEKFRESYAKELEKELLPEEEKKLCECFVGVIPTMNEEYAEIIQAVELGDEDPEELSSRLGITRNNLKVKRYRARKQLKERLEQTCRTCAAHGCIDCRCNS